MSVGAGDVERPMGRAPLLLASELGETAGGLAVAAAVAVAGAPAAGAVLAELGAPGRRRPTLLASPAARELEERLGGEQLTAAARGRLCWLALPADESGLDLLERIPPLATGALVVAHMPAALWQPALERSALAPAGALLRAELPAQRALAALAVGELRARGARARLAAQPLGAIGARRALAGLEPGGAASARAARLARGLLGRREPQPAAGRADPKAPLPQAGQALPLVLGAAFVTVFVALLLAALGGALTGAAGAQRAADLAALSAARSMRDDLPRLLAPERLPNGSLNPRHMVRAEYLARASDAAREAGERNGVDPRRLAVTFPDRASSVPVRAAVDLVADVEPGGDLRPAGRRGGSTTEHHAEAEAAPPAGYTGMPRTATGGGYAGPLAYRQGKGMRPDVAAAFDRLAAAAARAGVPLVITSAYRSDAEQARLFAQNPDPRWVAPPGTSLHRCGTELDLGPAAAYGWLARNAPRFGFVRRYAWEAWHFGFDQGPAPCSAASDAVGRGGRGGREGRGGAAVVPAFVPAAYRAPLARSAARWGVSAGLLAAQLEAESGFDPRAVSPAGAQGIAQFMPATAAAYGLRNPFDPAAAIDAQGRLMSELLARFDSIPLALAAYNAGPGAVAACSCVPPYPETQAYVARILALLDGAGELAVPQLEVRLVG